MISTWKKTGTFAVGGLREMGFYNDTNYLMVMSDNRGIFDCQKAAKIARNYDDYYHDSWDDQTGLVDGFDLLEGKKIHCGGFEHPDIMKKATSDGWKIILKNERRPDYKKDIISCEVMYLVNNQTNEAIELMTFFYGIDRAYGFSNNDNCFVIGTSSDLHIWTKENAIN